MLVLLELLFYLVDGLAPPDCRRHIAMHKCELLQAPRHQRIPGRRPQLSRQRALVRRTCIPPPRAHTLRIVVWDPSALSLPLILRRALEPYDVGIPIRR